MKKKAAVWGMVATCFVLICGLGVRSFGNLITTNNPSLQPASNIGAWYDEDWQATGFYRLEKGSDTPASEEFAYRYTSDPVSAPNNVAVFKQENATIPQDVVVTEWKVSGHVHFKSGM